MALPQLVKIQNGNLLGRLTIEYDKANDTIRGGLAIVDMRTGKITGSRSIEVPIGKIREAVIAIHQASRPSAPSELAGDTFALAGFWSDVKKRANGISKQVGAKKLLRVARKVMNDPRFAQGLAAASMIYPPLGMTVAQIQKANTMVLKASTGDPTAASQIAVIVDRAKGGDPHAQKLAAGLMALRDAHQNGQDPMAVVGGWMNRKERNPAPAFHPSHPSPLRRLYLAAVNR